MEALLKIDRRYIFLLLAIIIMVAFGFGHLIDVPVGAGRPVKDVFQAIDTLEPRPGRERAVMLFSMDFDPASSPELSPMTAAMLRHALRKGHKIVGMTHWPAGVALADGLLSAAVREFDDVLFAYELFDSQESAATAEASAKKDLGAAPKQDLAAELKEAIESALAAATSGEKTKAMVEAIKGKHRVAVVRPGAAKVRATPAGADLEWHVGLHKLLAAADPGSHNVAYVGGGKWMRAEVLWREPNLTYGRDYCFLGQRAGHEVLILSMGQSIYDSFPTDSKQNRTRDMEILKDVPTLREIDYLMTLAAGDTSDKWVLYGHEKYGFPMSVGCTAVMAPDLYPYRQAQQIDGIVGGIRGAWEYEALTGIPGKARDAVPAQTAAHLLIILLIIVCNVGYFAGRRRKRT
ncbi:hypothetical protein ACFL59_07390 [Planctomycetota bacterium]